MTWSFDDEIIGFKEELREQGIPEEVISKTATEIEEAYRTKGGPPDLEAVKRKLTERESPSELTTPRTEEIPNRRRRNGSGVHIGVHRSEKGVHIGV